MITQPTFNYYQMSDILYVSTYTPSITEAIPITSLLPVSVAAA